MPVSQHWIGPVTIDHGFTSFWLRPSPALADDPNASGMLCCSLHENSIPNQVRCLKRSNRQEYALWSNHADRLAAPYGHVHDTVPTMSLDLQQPTLIAHFGELEVYNEGRGFVLPRVRALFACQPERYTDLCGEGSRRVVHLLDWSHFHSPWCVTAAVGHVVVAAAWAGKIRRHEDGAFGCNLSFAVSPAYAGKGLATLLASIAFAQCFQAHPEIEFANLQTADSNQAAQAIATRLGIPRQPSFDRTSPEPDGRTYITFRGSSHDLAKQCLLVIAAACSIPSEMETPAEAPAA